MLGYYTLILHTHLPYVLNHGKWPHGSDWLSEAAAECYIPMLQMLERLHDRNIKTKVSMDFSPVNLEQLADPAFVDVFSAYCDEKVIAAEKDADYFKSTGELHLLPMAEFWHEYYSNTKRLFLNTYQGNLVTGFRRLAEKGVLDAMTCGATHGYFPLLLDDRNIQAQLRVAIDAHEKHFGMRPSGVWLPECAYRPAYAWKPSVGPAEFQDREPKERKGIEEFLPQLGLRYFIVDGALIKGGRTVRTYPRFIIDPPPQKVLKEVANSKLSPQKIASPPLPETDGGRSLAELYTVRTSERPMHGEPPVVFGRDGKTAAQVWSSELGYPGCAPYLEFHKKHHNSGLRYWSVTGPKIDLGEKVPYDPRIIDAQLESNAEHFCTLIREQLVEHALTHPNPGIISSPFDTELFGHWWFEGPRFLEKVIEKIEHMTDIEITHCRDAVDNKALPHTMIALPEGSWGFEGAHQVWMNPDVAWMWDILYPLEERFLKTLDFTQASFGSLNEETLQSALYLLLEQAGRELLLLEASDWEFLITTKGAIDYSTERFNTHANALTALLDTIDEYLAGHGIDEEELNFVEEIAMKDRIFPEISLNAWM